MDTKSHESDGEDLYQVELPDLFSDPAFLKPFSDSAREMLLANGMKPKVVAKFTDTQAIAVSAQLAAMFFRGEI